MRENSDCRMVSIRTLFLSDIHLGCKYARVDQLLQLLQQHRPQQIYLVGDIIDGWRLRKKWHWPPEHTQVIQRLLALAQQGTRLLYTPGNHDEFLRAFLGNFGLVEIENEFIHETAAGQYFLVTHGDLFDAVERRARWLSMLGAFAYDSLCCVSRWNNLLRQRLGLQDRCFSSAVKHRVKSAVRFIGDYENSLIAHARSRGCDGVICGHVHTPTMTTHGSLSYYNIGDWVESRTALIEHHDGRLELIRHDQIDSLTPQSHPTDLPTSVQPPTETTASTEVTVTAQPQLAEQTANA